MQGRRKPYTKAEIKNQKCIRCGAPARFTWQICSDDNLYRPICELCDIALNRMVLKWAGFPDWKEKIKRYITSFNVNRNFPQTPCVGDSVTVQPKTHEATMTSQTNHESGKPQEGKAQPAPKTETVKPATGDQGKSDRA